MLMWDEQEAAVKAASMLSRKWWRLKEEGGLRYNRSRQRRCGSLDTPESPRNATLSRMRDTLAIFVYNSKICICRDGMSDHLRLQTTTRV